MRSRYRQTCHDQAVARSAGQYLSYGYKVWADIPDETVRIFIIGFVMHNGV